MGEGVDGFKWDKASYVLANPVAAGLVPHGRDWPGLWSSPEEIEGGTIEAKRPSVFFRSEGSMPEKVELELRCPPGFDLVTDFRDQLAVALAAREERAAGELMEQGRRFVGVRRVMAQNPLASPAPGEPRRELNPRVAARDKWKRIEALARAPITDAPEYLLTGILTRHGLRKSRGRSASKAIAAIRGAA